MNLVPRSAVLLPILSATALVASIPPVQAQARPAAARSAGITLFGAITRVSPAYSSDTNYGALIGADFTRYFHLLSPSLEVRYTDSSGPTVGESTIAGGLKVERRFGRFIPYADFLVGYGSITFEHPVIYPTGPYSSDNSFITSAGGGLDFKLSRSIALKFDAQSQSWKLGSDQSRRSPSAVSLGLSIDLPFLALPGRR